MPRRKRKCHHCKRFFLPHPASSGRQHYCSERACQQARKAANNHAFRRRNPDYFRGPDQVQRVQEWRREHPGYWRNESRNQSRGVVGASGSAVALQADLAPELLAGAVVGLREGLHALQAASERQATIMQGLASHLTGRALQADLGAVLNAWYDRGRCLTGPPSGMPSVTCQEPASEPASACSSRAGAPAVRPEELQLGRPPAGS